MQDGNGRLHARREPRARRGVSRQLGEAPGQDSPAAPRFVFVRTCHGNLWRFHVDLGASPLRELARLAAKEAPLPEQEAAAGIAPPERLEAWRRNLAGADKVGGGDPGGGGGGADGAALERRSWALRSPGAGEIGPIEEEDLLVYEAGGPLVYLLPGAPRGALDAARRLGLEPFAEIYELGG